MSSYHPNQDPSLLQINVGNLPLYIGDEQGIVAAIADSEGFSYSLEESEYPGTNLTKSTFDVTANDTEYAQEWVYDGNIFHRPEVKVDPKRYFEILGNLVADDDELTIEKTHLDSIYMIGSIGLNESARIAYYKNMSRVNYSNSAEDIGTGYYSSTSFSVKPRPVTSEVASSQLRVQLKGYYFALNALSVAVNSHEIKHVRKFTPQGSEVFDRPMQTFPTRDNLPAVIEKPKLEPAQVIKEKLMLDSLSGNEQLKRQLQHVVLSFKNPDIMKKWGAQRPQGVLLHGPAGTGKTSFAQAVANEIGGELWVIDSTKIYKKWLGESEQQMKNLFRAAKNKTDPTVMLFDEFDSIITHSDDTSGGSRAANSVSGIFKQEMNDLRESNPNILVFATTNRIDAIDEATIRAGRFDIKAQVALPDEAARREIFASKLAEIDSQLSTDDDTFTPFAQDINITELAAHMPEKSGADIVEVLRRATFEKAMTEIASHSTQNVPISQADLLKIIAAMRFEP